jgi:hypothetical protein
MRSVATVSLLAVALLLVPAVPTQAQGHGGGHGFQELAVSHGGGFHGAFHGHLGFRGHGVTGVRQQLFVWVPSDGEEPDEVVMVAQFVPQFADPAPSEAPIPDPKFVFPPTPSPWSPSGSHTIIVQRGSQIEGQSFPPAR